MGYKALVLTWGSPSAVGACLGREEGTLEPTFAQSSESLKGSIDLGAAPEAATMGGAERIPPPPGSEPRCQESSHTPTNSHALLQCKSEHRSETRGGKPKRKTQSPADSFPAAPASPPALPVSLGQTVLAGTHHTGLVRPNCHFLSNALPAGVLAHVPIGSLPLPYWPLAVTFISWLPIFCQVYTCVANFSS